jgi:hypothetical protein
MERRLRCKPSKTHQKQMLTHANPTVAGDPSLSARVSVRRTDGAEGDWSLGGHTNTNEWLIAAARARIAELSAILQESESDGASQEPIQQFTIIKHDNTTLIFLALDLPGALHWSDIQRNSGTDFKWEVGHHLGLIEVPEDTWLGMRFRQSCP